MCENINSLIGENIARLRKKSGLTVENLAELSGLRPLHLAQIEAGLATAGPEEIYALKLALKVEVKDFYRGLSL